VKNIGYAPVRISPQILSDITNIDNERNVYVHPNPMARDIFWQRLESIIQLLDSYAQNRQQALDFGGGSGMLCKPLSHLFDSVDIIDLDTSDAEKVIEYFDFHNINLICEDIGNFDNKLAYDLIIAADVLEHFSDLQIPLQFIKRHIKSDGLLIVSLPTENGLYTLGRAIIRKTKPLDHYHSSTEVMQVLADNGFKLVSKRYCPRYVFPIPLFEIAAFRC